MTITQSVHLYKSVLTQTNRTRIFKKGVQDDKKEIIRQNYGKLIEKKDEKRQVNGRRVYQN